MRYEEAVASLIASPAFANFVALYQTDPDLSIAKDDFRNDLP
jgi:hypothetical protein